jgi:hypothetical protein
MAVTTTNLIMGPATLYTGAFGATEPTDASVNTTPAVSAWTDMGGTDSGVKLTVDQKFVELKVDQVVDRVGSRMTSRDFVIDTSLAEPTMANLSLALNGGTSATGSGYASFEPLYTGNSSTQPTYIAMLFDGFAPSSFRRRVIARRVLSVDKVESSYTKDKQTFLNVKFMAHYVSASIAPLHVVDQTS